MVRKKRKQSFPLIIMVVLSVLILVVAGVLLTKKKESIVDGKYDTFAQCLYDKGMRMYGSVTCSFCARQRAIFEGSFEHIKEIECDPRNADNEAERCIAKDITHTPTWILEDAEGNDIERLEAGVHSLEKLSEVAQCELLEDEQGS